MGYVLGSGPGALCKLFIQQSYKGRNDFATIQGSNTLSDLPCHTPRK